MHIVHGNTTNNSQEILSEDTNLIDSENDSDLEILNYPEIPREQKVESDSDIEILPPTGSTQANKCQQILSDIAKINWETEK